MLGLNGPARERNSSTQYLCSGLHGPARGRTTIELVPAFGLDGPARGRNSSTQYLRSVSMLA